MLRYDWDFWGRPEQQWPEGNWFLWMILSGRGWGKTRTAVENIARMVRGPTPLQAPAGAPGLMTIIADTSFDMRQYTIEGPSGFLNVGPPDHRPNHNINARTMTWPNGCKALLFSAEDPDALRGASGSFFWWDELAKARQARDGWNNMLFGMREGRPRGIVTTTPRPLPLVKELLQRPSTVVTRGSTWDNQDNLAKEYYDNVIAPLDGTRLGRQEIGGEIVDDIPGALWTRAMIDEQRVSELPPMSRVVVAIDPSGTDGDDEGDDVGIVVAGRGIDGRGYVIADNTCKLSPEGWARVAITAYHRHEADRIVAERNFGGAMVRAVVKASEAGVPFKEVVASRGKAVRAEPVSALYEQGRISHVGAHVKLEDEMVLMTTAGYMGEGSPNRVDAVVWALTEVMLGHIGAGREIATAIPATVTAFRARR